MKFDDIPALRHPAIKVIQGSIQSVDCENLTATISRYNNHDQQTVDYDYFIAATGLRRPWPVVPQSLTRDTYLKETQANIDAIESSRHGVVIVGGGAVGVEMAAECKMVQPSAKVTLVHSRDQLLSAEPLPDEFKDGVAPLVREAGVELILSQRVASTQSADTPNTTGSTQTLTLANGNTLQASHVLKAVSASVPTSRYLPAITLDAEGYVKIEPTLHFKSESPNSNLKRHFAVGDIALWSGIKRCGAAMHMGHFAAYNIHQGMISSQGNEVSKPKYMSLNEFPPVIGLAVGKKAISYGPEQGVKMGEDVMALMFGDDLGWSICWNYLRLGEKNPDMQNGKKEELGLEELELGGSEEKEMLKAMEGKNGENVVVKEIVASVA